jgi:hypothetical protein
MAKTYTAKATRAIEQDNNPSEESAKHSENNWKLVLQVMKSSWSEPRAASRLLRLAGPPGPREDDRTRPHGPASAMRRNHAHSVRDRAG